MGESLVIYKRFIGHGPKLMLTVAARKLAGGEKRQLKASRERR
jgi:hypothetical protein